MQLRMQRSLRAGAWMGAIQTSNKYALKANDRVSLASYWRLGQSLPLVFGAQNVTVVMIWTMKDSIF